MAKGLRILLVDDDEDEYVCTRDLFREIGGEYQLAWVRTYEDALREIQACHFDAFILDYNLGPRTGIELLEEAQALGCRAPMIILTGASDRSVDLEAMEAGAADYLDKGQLSPALLERSIRYALERRRAEDKLRDSDERVRALLDAEAKLHAAVRTRDEFLGIASHELRTPLTPLTLQLGQLRRALRDSDLLPLVDSARRQAARVADLIESLLDVTRIAEGKFAVRRDRCELGVLLREVVERFQPQALAAHCELQLHIESEVVGNWDRFRLEQVIANLLSNALKYGRGHPVELHLHEGDEGVRLAVRDHGIGIAKEHVGRIFGRFERAVSPRHYGGLGLGLYVASEIVEAHGGCILVQSEPGRGATFTILLPREEVSSSVSPSLHH